MSNVIDFTAKKLDFLRQDLLDYILKEFEHYAVPGASVMQAMLFSMNELAKKVEPYGSAHVFLHTKVRSEPSGAYFDFHLYHVPVKPASTDGAEDSNTTAPYMTFKLVDLADNEAVISEGLPPSDIDTIAQEFAGFVSNYNAADIWTVPDIFMDFVESQLRIMPVVRIVSNEDRWSITFNYHGVSLVEITYHAKVAQEWTQALHNYLQEPEE